MTRDEILAMKPGREMDALIWLAVIGERKDPVMELMICRHVDGDIQPYSGYPEGHISPPHYSTDIADTWKLLWIIQNVLSGQSMIQITNDDGDSMDVYMCFSTDIAYWRSGQVTIEEGMMEDAPEAICKAVLIAVLGDKE